MTKSNRFSKFVAPRRLGASDGVQDDQQLVDASDQSDLSRLAGGQQPCIEGFEHAIEARAAQGGHEQHAAKAGPTPEDAALSTQRARVKIYGGQAPQRGDLLSIELAHL